MEDKRFKLVIGAIFICLCSLGYAEPKRSAESVVTRLKISTLEGELNCTLDRDKGVVPKIVEEIRAKRLDGSFVCRSVMDYFVQFGCRKSTMSNIERKPLGFQLPKTGRHNKIGVVSAVKGSGAFGRLQLVVMLRPANWLDGTQTVIGHCGDVGLVRRLARKPTVAGGIPRKPTEIVTMEILGPDSSKRRNGLAK